MIGDTSVGKSCLLTRFADDQFTDNYVTTIGVDFRFKTMIVMDKIVKVQVWDTAGQERYRSITNAYYRGAEGILVVFDLTNKESFNNIQNCNIYWRRCDFYVFGEQKRFKERNK